MNYIEYIQSKASIIGTTHARFTIQELYGAKQSKLKDIKNADFYRIYRSIWAETIDREFVKSAFSKDIYEGFVTCMLWGGAGLGPGNSWNNLVAAMSYPRDQVVHKLNAVKDLLIRDELEQAFNSMLSSSPEGNKIPGVGISYFTKILFFLSLNIPGNTQSPLIFDKWAQYIHAALLIDDSTQNVFEWYNIYNDKKGFHVKARTPFRAYTDYVFRIKQIISNQGLKLPHPGVLEEFLFGRELKSKLNRDENNPRYFVSNYVKAYYTTLNIPNKEQIVSTSINITQIQQGRKIKNRIVSYGYKFEYNGLSYYLVVGRKKTFSCVSPWVNGFKHCKLGRGIV